MVRTPAFLMLTAATLLGGTAVLSDLDLEVPAGRTVALVGRTGSGKSTLLSLLPRLIDPPEGTVFMRLRL